MQASPIGPEANILEPSELQCRRLFLDTPILSIEDLEVIQNLSHKDWKVCVCLCMLNNWVRSRQPCLVCVLNLEHRYLIRGIWAVSGKQRGRKFFGKRRWREPWVMLPMVFIQHRWNLHVCPPCHFRWSVVATDIDWRSQNLRHLYPCMGFQLGYWGFPAIKIIVIRQVRMYCCLTVKINMRESCKACKNRVCVLFAFVSACVVSKNLNTPNLSSMADDPITQGGIGGPGSPF